MKLLFILPSLGNGGAEMHALRLANQLSKQGHQIAIAVFRKGGSYERKLDPSVELIGLSNGIRSSTLAMLASLKPLTRLLKTGDFDCALSYVANANAAHAWAHRRSGKRVPMVACVQNHFASESKNASLLERLTVFPTALRGILASRFIIFLSEGVQQGLQELAKKPLPQSCVINNIGYDSDVAQRAAADSPSLQADCFNLIACGRLHPQKDYPTLLQAIALIPDDARIHLSILGKGPLEAELKALAETLNISHRVTFLGFQDNPYAFVAQADLFVLSSQWEGFGNVIVEAMACGTPVLSTDCPHGPAEILDHGRCGVLVPCQNPQAMKDAILDLANSPEKRTAFSQSALQRIENYSPEKIADQHLEALTQILDS